MRLVKAPRLHLKLMGAHLKPCDSVQGDWGGKGVEEDSNVDA